MLASQTESSLVAAAEMQWSLGSVATDFLVLETRLDSLAMVTMVLVAVGLAL